MIHIERTKDGKISVGMSGHIEDLFVEVTIAIKDILKSVPPEAWGALVAEISANALMFAREDMEEGCDGVAVTIADHETLEEAIKKTTGGEK